jgi:stage II sporulation protein D
MTIINVLPLEEYLYGVVPSEIEASSHIEALKAQAVAARTYALSSMSKHSKYFFNLCSTTDCQVYGGYDKENTSTNKSIDDTRGKIVTYNGKPATTYFFSSDGGSTEDCKNVWSADLPYLKSVEDNYESGNSWNYSWKQTLTSDKIKSLMQGKGYDLGDITNIEATKLSNAGRVVEMVITGTKGTKTFKNEPCRTILGLPSQMFNIASDADTILTATGKDNDVIQLGDKNVMTADGLKTLASEDNKITLLSGDGIKKSTPIIPKTFTITGKGWGHAVGMSQEGAKGMANQGFTYDQILTHFYTGTIIE